MLSLKVGFRNIFRQKKRSLFTALSMLSGFVLGAIFIGWADGSYNNIINTFTRHRLGHIQIHEKSYLDRPSLYKTIDTTREIEPVLEQIRGIDNWAPRIYSSGLATVGEESAGVRIIGIHPTRETLTTRFDNKIIEGQNFSSSPSHEAIIGKGLVQILDTGLEDEIVIITQGADGSIANDLYTIIGIVETGNKASDRTSFYLHLEDAQELLVLQERVHEIAVTVSDLDEVRKISQVLEKRISNPDLSVKTWQEFARSFYIAMKADKQGMWIMLVVIMLIVAVGVFNTVLMSVLERQREYGVLKAVGTKPSQVIWLVLTETNILALMCIAAGIVAGLLANFFLSRHGISLSKTITYGGMTIRYLKSEINVRSFVIPTLTILLSATLVSLIPAVKAARTDPAQSMRFH